MELRGSHNFDRNKLLNMQKQRHVKQCYGGKSRLVATSMDFTRSSPLHLDRKSMPTLNTLALSQGPKYFSRVRLTSGSMNRSIPNVNYQTLPTFANQASDVKKYKFTK